MLLINKNVINTFLFGVHCVDLWHLMLQQDSQISTLSILLICTKVYHWNTTIIINN